MEPEFWLERWARNETAFHLPEVNPDLRAWWPSLDLPSAARVFVPLAGKTVDLRWLRERGHAVVASELSEDAAAAFFAEAGLKPRRSRLGAFTHLAAHDIEYLVGDFFALGRELVGHFDAIWDRGALVALPPDLRKRYAAQLKALSPPTAQRLLITLEYAQDLMKGPPFSVTAAEVAALFGDTHEITLLVREDILEQEPRFRARGLSSLASCAYRLTGRA